MIAVAPARHIAGCLLIAIPLAGACGGGSSGTGGASGAAAQGGQTPSGSGGLESAAGDSHSAAGGGSGGTSSFPSDATSNRLFRLSGTEVSFHSGSAESEVVLQAEALVNGVVLTASPVSPELIGEPTAVVDEVNITKMGAATANVHIHRRGPALLPAGTFHGQVRVRGCLDEDCEDLFVNVSYTVIQLLIDGQSPGFLSDLRVYQHSGLRLTRALDDDALPSRELMLSHSDGSDSAWTAELEYAGSRDAPKDWLTITTAGESLSAPLRLSVDRRMEEPLGLDARLSITTAGTTVSLQVAYDTLSALEVERSELSFSAKIGEAPEAQRIELSDRLGSSYRFTTRSYDRSPGGPCGAQAKPWLEWRLAGPDELQTTLEVPGTLVFHAAPLDTAGECEMEVVVDAFNLEHRRLRVTYQVTE